MRTNINLPLYLVEHCTNFVSNAELGIDGLPYLLGYISNPVVHAVSRYPVGQCFINHQRKVFIAYRRDAFGVPHKLPGVLAFQAHGVHYLCFWNYQHNPSPTL